MPIRKKKMRIAIAFSGGVDSLVAAMELLDGGHDVFGVYMHLWRYQMHAEAVERESERVKNAAYRIGLPLRIVNFEKLFRESVVEYYLRALEDGLTPNPCVTCNCMIKWGALLEFVLAEGAEKLATGHYARLRTDSDGVVSLFKGIDQNKDQSYILSVLKQDVLRHMCLPIGELRKTDVINIAQNRGVQDVNAEESQDLCFLNGINQEDFIKANAPKILLPGEIVDSRGVVLGQHQGLAFYTIGQRKGIGIAAPEPYYVLGKDLVANRLIVGKAEILGKRRLLAKNANWISGEAPDPSRLFEIKIRYRAKPVSARIEMQQDRKFLVQFEQDLRDITPGQLAVVYDRDQCIGSGEIVHALD